MPNVEDSTGARASTIPGSRSATAPERLLPRGRHDLSREVVARTQRDRLVDAMAATVAAKGYVGASLGDVCGAAGVSTKAFYQHFADKETCFLATFELGVRVLQENVVTAYRRPGSWPERMRHGLAALLDTLAAEPAFAALAVVEVMAAGPRARQCRRDLLAGYLRFFDDAPASVAARVPSAATEAVVAGVYGVIFEYVATGRVAELPDRLADLTYFVLVPFLGRSPAAAAAGLLG
ncbi:MAG TPA: TetR/AcrR family transcriptional regulator [Mycobacteriales bacterium]|nr:TetR/AcrR family transcriptional regulator [Mycobacteriales bacterium]